MHKRTDTNTHISVEELQSAMSKFPLKKSYVDTRNPKKPARDIAFYKLWDEARNNGFVGNILNLETGERMTNLEILDLVSIWLFTYGLHPIYIFLLVKQFNTGKLCQRCIELLNLTPNDANVNKFL